MEEEIYTKIREIRKQRGITLKELGERTNLSPSFLSQIERGVSSMTITSMKKVADALDISLSALLEGREEKKQPDRLSKEPDAKEARHEEVEAKFIHRKVKKEMLYGRNSDLIDYVSLSGFFPGRKLEILMVELEPHLDDSEMLVHEGEEFYYIIEGEADFIIDDEACTLSAGETLHFPSTMPHKYFNNHDKKLKMICVVTPTYF